MDISTSVHLTPERVSGKGNDEALTCALAQVERDIVLLRDHMAASSRPGETIGAVMIPTMQTGICFNDPKPNIPKNERKIPVVPVKIY